jgi:hypothetical protein
MFISTYKYKTSKLFSGLSVGRVRAFRTHTAKEYKTIAIRIQVWRRVFVFYKGEALCM